MTAPTLARPLPESAEPDHATTESRSAHTPAPSPVRRRLGRRNDGGFSMLELLVGMVILGVLGAIGYGVYVGFIRDARDTALDQNIQTAAAEMQSVLSLDPTLADNTDNELVTAMTNRTNFVWDDSWAFVSGDEPDTIRFQFLTDATAVAHATTAAAPAVQWLVDDESAVRMHITNAEGEWRCALLILKPSPTDLKALTVLNLTGTSADADAAAKAAELRGIWYDGGSNIDSSAYTGLHDCSPVSAEPATGTMNTNVYSTTSCTAAGVAASDDCLPSDAQTWVMPDATANQVDSTSTAITSYRTLHRSTSDLDSNA